MSRYSKNFSIIQLLHTLLTRLSMFSSLSQFVQKNWHCAMAGRSGIERLIHSTTFQPWNLSNEISSDCVNTQTDMRLVLKSAKIQNVVYIVSETATKFHLDASTSHLIRYYDFFFWISKRFFLQTDNKLRINAM